MKPLTPSPRLRRAVPPHTSDGARNLSSEDEMRASSFGRGRRTNSGRNLAQLAEDVENSLVAQRLRDIGGEELRCRQLIVKLTDVGLEAPRVAEIVADVRRRLSRLRDMVEVLRIESDCAVGMEEDVSEDIEQHMQEIKAIETELRRAHVAQDGGREKLNRSSLFGEVPLRKQLNNTVGGESLEDRRLKEISSAETLNDRLSEMTTTLMDQLSKASETNETLMRSSGNLVGVNEEYGNLAGQIGRTDHLTTKMMRRKRTDKVLIGLCLVFFFLSVLYVIQCRIGFPRIWRLLPIPFLW